MSSLPTGSPQAQWFRLIITAPENVPFTPFWHKVEVVFTKLLPGYREYGMYATPLSTGYPYHLPLSFPSYDAQQLADALRKLNCDVRIVPE